MPDPLRILVIDDNPADLRLLELYLKRISGWTVTCETCNTARTAPERFAEVEPDVVFVDYLLDTENGIDLIRKFRPERPDTAYVLLTGHGDERVAAEAMRAGAHDYVTKGEISTETLERSLRYVGERQRTERALRQSEERFELAARGSQDGLWDWTDPNTEHQAVWWSPRFYDLLGYDEGELPPTLDIFRNLLHPDDVVPTFAAVDAHLRDRSPFDEEFRLRTKSGDHRWFRGRGQAIWDDDGRPTRMSGSIRDVEDRKRAETELQRAHENLEAEVAERTRELRKAMEQAEVANRAKSELLANMSHELRTPLNAIIGFSNAIREQMFGPLENEKYREYMDDIFASGTHLLDLINDILDVSAIEAGRLELHEEDLDVAGVADAAIRLVRPRADQGDVKIESHLAMGLPLLHADERRLKQILVNLLTNAVKFTPENGRVTFSTKIVDGGAMVMAVADTGIGMTEDEITKARTVFGQVKDASSRKHEGTGLGLPLTIGLMELHGGTLVIDSEKDAGTTVTVHFPAKRVRAG